MYLTSVRMINSALKVCQMCRLLFCWSERASNSLTFARRTVMSVPKFPECRLLAMNCWQSGSSRESKASCSWLDERE